MGDVLSTDQNLQVIFSLQTTASTKTPPVFQQRMIGHINLTTDTEAPSTGRSEPAPGFCGKACDPTTPCMYWTYRPKTRECSLMKSCCPSNVAGYQSGLVGCPEE